MRTRIVLEPQEAGWWKARLERLLLLTKVVTETSGNTPEVALGRLLEEVRDVRWTTSVATAPRRERGSREQ